MLRGELIKVTAQSLGIDDLSDTCVRALLPEVELRVREIIQDAMKFRSHSKRTHLTTTHINQALQTRNIEVGSFCMRMSIIYNHVCFK